MIRRKEGIEMKKGLKSLVLLGSISLVGFGLVGCQNVENIAKDAKTKIQQSVRNDDEIINKALNRKYNHSDYSIKETLETLAKYRGVSTKVHAKLVDNGNKVKCWIGKEDEYDENYLCMYIMADTGKIYEIDDATVRVDITDPENLGQYEAENFEGWDTADDTTDGDYSGEGLDNEDYDGSEDYPDEDTTENGMSNQEALQKVANAIDESFNGSEYKCTSSVSGGEIASTVKVTTMTRNDLVALSESYSSSLDYDNAIKALIDPSLQEELKEMKNEINKYGYDATISMKIITNDGATIARCSTASGWQIVHY